MNEYKNSGNFRQDINALRALAVVAVVGYHFQIPGFAGGFVGVDIFFLISGYLITGQVLNQLQESKFSLFGFWVSRLRRIFPALFVMTVGAVAMGWAFTMPGEYMKHIRQALSALAFVSNLTLDGERGYFDVAAQTKPLLHTWSLSIEWQFYFFLPLILLLFWRFSHATHKLSLALKGLFFLALASLSWCLWRSYIDPSNGFFSIRTRAWELLLGGVIAGIHLERKNNPPLNITFDISRYRLGASLLDWLLLAISVTAALPSDNWPGLLTLLPLSGAALVVVSSSLSTSQRIIGFQSVQRIGDWSYSIYLWHWPLWVFVLEKASFSNISIEWPYKFILVVLTVMLGFLSYRFIEQPFRSRLGFWSPRRLVIGCGLSFTVMLCFTAAVLITHGFPNRLPDYQQHAELVRRTSTPRDECFRDVKSIKKSAGEFCDFGAPAGPASINAILWGDSLANQYLEPITRAAIGTGLHGFIATQSACRAFLNTPLQNQGVPQSCNQFNQKVFDFIRAARQPSIVILGRNWGGGGAKEVAKLIDALLSSGNTVVLILPSLNVGFDTTQSLMENQYRAGHAINEWSLEATPELVQSSVRQEISNATKLFSNNPKFITVDPLPIICDQKSCFLVRNGQANFRDTIHISNVNVSQYDDIFKNALRRAWVVSQPQTP